ncbi:DUF4157 domain-containing protein [Taibaiella soli]|uniref:DUF4157 domain-containing protein n=1 Tax=Taibaiella soli TaxID=1649169 RepID=A0A2W2ATZ2_9BACT|nr:DUF4157 domain-containing protein [Taibaiella soli]PZF71434.1 DUF4157 domain-containing protein [Taibaiella soli]
MNLNEVKIKENSWFARLAAAKLGSERVAIVWRHTIHLHNTTKSEFLADQRWVDHELKHVEQFERYGWLQFAFLYLIESIRHGYFNNKFEQEAREAENAKSHP